MYNNRENNEEIRNMKALTAAVFRVTENFSGGEILKNKIQEKSLDIFAKSNPSFDSVMVKDINVLKNFLNLARDLKFTKEINCEVLMREYDKVLEFINSRITTDVDKIRVLPRSYPRESASTNLTERQQKIFHLFKSKKELRLKEISKVFSNVTPRTLRNDLRGLVGHGLVVNQGMGAGSIYKIKYQK